MANQAFAKGFEKGARKPYAAKKIPDRTFIPRDNEYQDPKKDPERLQDDGLNTFKEAAATQPRAKKERAARKYLDPLGDYQDPKPASIHNATEAE